MYSDQPPADSKWNPGPVSDPSIPRLRIPPGSVNAHCHIFGPFERFPYPESAPFIPPEAPLESLIELDDRMGFAREVIVETGLDENHASLIDALERFPDRIRGVALVGLETSRDEIERLSAAGVRGCRINFMPHLSQEVDWAQVGQLVDLVEPVGWHLQIHTEGDGVAENAKSIAELPIDVVIDHMGRVNLEEGLNGPSARALFELLDTGHVWIKTSGADRLTNEPGSYRDVLPLAASLVRRAPERMLWGTDWPHVNIFGWPPDDGVLTDYIAEFAPDPDHQRLMLVDNPARLYGFGTV